MNTSSCLLFFLRNLPRNAILTAVAMAAAGSATFAAPVLTAGTFKHHIDTFNAQDNELYTNALPNAKAWDFLAANIPLFACPDEDLERTYYFRWWTYRKHLREAPDGWVITEFLPKVPCSAKVLRERGKDYNHSSFCDLIITGLAGLRPRADDVVEIHPLVPDGKWDWFCLDKVAYHGRTLTILWDKTGTKYSKGKGLRVFADGREIAHSDTLGRVTAPLPKSQMPSDASPKTPESRDQNTE